MWPFNGWHAAFVPLIEPLKTSSAEAARTAKWGEVPLPHSHLARVTGTNLNKDGVISSQLHCVIHISFVIIQKCFSFHHTVRTAEANCVKSEHPGSLKNWEVRTIHLKSNLGVTLTNKFDNSENYITINSVFIKKHLTNIISHKSRGAIQFSSDYSKKVKN